MSTFKSIDKRSAEAAPPGGSSRPGLVGPNPLRVGASSDPHEREADRIAAEVISGPAALSERPAPVRVQHFHDSSTAGSQVAPASVEREVARSGRPLEPGLLGEMEQRFGHDFSRVRVHTGTQAEQSAQEVNAEAYSVGHQLVFGAGQFVSSTHDGRRRIAHELAHVLQQPGDGTVVRRQVHGPKATATPADWKDKVNNAGTSADRVALIQPIASPVKVVDKTADAKGDVAVDAQHCVKWDDTNPTVSYDDDLNSKRGRGSSAGYTKEVSSGRGAAKKSDYYIVLGRKALDPQDLTKTTVFLNHEFDHVRAMRSASTLTGDEAEIATWTSSFVREFHRSYSIRDRSDGVTSYIDPGFTTFTQLGNYYARSTDATVKGDAVKKIADYYNLTIKPHAVHDRVFRYWIHRGINALGIPELCGAVNDKLGKIVDPAKDVKTYWEMPTSLVKAATFTGPPTVQVP